MVENERIVIMRETLCTSKERTKKADGCTMHYKPVNSSPTENTSVHCLSRRSFALPGHGGVTPGDDRSRGGRGWWVYREKEKAGKLPVT